MEGHTGLKLPSKTKSVTKPNAAGSRSLVVAVRMDNREGPTVEIGGVGRMVMEPKER